MNHLITKETENIIIIIQRYNMEKVKFIEMKDGDKEDYDLLAKFEDKYIQGTAERVIRILKNLDSSIGGYQISRLEHSLQAASRALRDNADEEMIVASLLHDIGDEIAPLNHSEISAAVLRPFVTEKTQWIVQQHGLFQSYYYNHHYGQDRNISDILFLRIQLNFVKLMTKTI